jgi:hypothetical protein
VWGWSAETALPIRSVIWSWANHKATVTMAATTSKMMDARRTTERATFPQPANQGPAHNGIRRSRQKRKTRRRLAPLQSVVAANLKHCRPAS